MSTRQVVWVAPELSEWANPQKNGALVYFVNIIFEDEDGGSIGTEDKAKAEELRVMLEGLVGAEAEFGLQDTGKKNGKGGTKWKLLSFPGYAPEPYAGGGGGGTARREYVPRFTDTPEGFAALQNRMDRRTALMQAVALNGGDEHIIAFADSFYEWLILAPASPSAAAPGEPIAATTLTPVATAGANPSGGVGEETLAYGEGTSGSNPTPPEHIHEVADPQPSTIRTGFEVCGCGHARKVGGPW